MDIKSIELLVEFLDQDKEICKLVCEAFTTHIMKSHDFVTVVNCIRVLDQVDPRYIDFLVSCDIDFDFDGQ